MLRLDAHLHVFAKVSAEFPRHSDQTMPADSEAPVEVLLQEMEEYGVDQAVLVQIGGAELDQHAYLRHCLKAHPKGKPKILSCPFCGKEFAHRGNYQTHLRIHTNERPFKCRMCNANVLPFPASTK